MSCTTKTQASGKNHTTYKIRGPTGQGHFHPSKNQYFTLRWKKTAGQPPPPGSCPACFIWEIDGKMFFPFTPFCCLLSNPKGVFRSKNQSFAGKKTTPSGAAWPVGRGPAPAPAPAPPLRQRRPPHPTAAPPAAPWLLWTRTTLGPGGLDHSGIGKALWRSGALLKTKGGRQTGGHLPRWRATVGHPPKETPVLSSGVAGGLPQRRVLLQDGHGRLRAEYLHDGLQRSCKGLGGLLKNLRPGRQGDKRQTATAHSHMTTIKSWAPTVSVAGLGATHVTCVTLCDSCGSGLSHAGLVLAGVPLSSLWNGVPTTNFQEKRGIQKRSMAGNKNPSRFQH